LLTAEVPPVRLRKRQRELMRSCSRPDKAHEHPILIAGLNQCRWAHQWPAGFSPGRLTEARLASTARSGFLSSNNPTKLTRRGDRSLEGVRTELADLG
jgi:hypothetical protein